MDKNTRIKELEYDAARFSQRIQQLEAEVERLKANEGASVRAFSAEVNEVDTLRAEVERLSQMVSPRYSIPIEEALGPLKPCPFCGSHNIGSHEGEVYCNRCDATNSTLSWQMRPPDSLAEVARLREALEFYADPTNYDEYGVPKIKHGEHRIGGRPCKVPDCGRTAKLALRGEVGP